MCNVASVISCRATAALPNRPNACRTYLPRYGYLHAVATCNLPEILQLAKATVTATSNKHTWWSCGSPAGTGCCIEFPPCASFFTSSFLFRSRRIRHASALGFKSRPTRLGWADGAPGHQQCPSLRPASPPTRLHASNKREKVAANHSRQIPGHQPFEQSFPFDDVQGCRRVHRAEHTTPAKISDVSAVPNLRSAALPPFHRASRSLQAFHGITGTGLHSKHQPWT